MAGFTWVVNDGEHQVYEGRYGLEQNQSQLRAGITPVQRLHREAISEHGDAFVKGARYCAKTRKPARQSRCTINRCMWPSGGTG